MAASLAARSKAASRAAKEKLACSGSVITLLSRNPASVILQSLSCQRTGPQSCN
jgi:hypothetical protein